MRLETMLTTTIVTCVLLIGNTQAMSRHSKTNVDLRTSHESLLRQNECVDALKLHRITNEEELASLVDDGRLVALPITDAVKIAPSLPSNRRYALPQTVVFLLTLAEAYRERFGTALVIDSAVRDAHTQKLLRRRNASAAPAEGDTASSHESGATIDLSIRMSRTQRKWLENMLAYYQAMNVVIVEEERACFHVMVIGDPE
jgi:Family of unknown function (DUF5715)